MEEKVENGEAERKNRSTEEATVRRKQEERERKKQRLSSEMLTRKQTKESGSQAPAPEENRKGKLKGDHLWNSCGSETGKDERKQTES